MALAVDVIDSDSRDLRSARARIAHAQQDRHVTMQQRSPLPFGFDREASVARRQVVCPQLDRSAQHLLELFVRKPDDLSLRMSDPMCPLS
jgi:hypothetical protein